MNRKLLGAGVVALLVTGYMAVRNRARLASAATTGRDRVKEVAGKVTSRRRGAQEDEVEEQAPGA
jgi:hypothetical protein